MSTEGTDLSYYDSSSVPNGSKWTFGIAVSEWNSEVTGSLRDGAIETLNENGVESGNITVVDVPGSYELPLASQILLEKKNVDAVIAIGSVVRGETAHFDYVCSAVSQGIKDVSLKHSKPVIFCVLTDDTMQQAIDRSGGKHGNKGVECAVAALKMLGLKEGL